MDGSLGARRVVERSLVHDGGPRHVLGHHVAVVAEVTRRRIEPGAIARKRQKQVPLNTLQPSRDPSTGWRCHSTGAGDTIQY